MAEEPSKRTNGTPADDIFDKVLRLEESFLASGEELGKRAGVQQGLEEGRKLVSRSPDVQQAFDFRASRRAMRSDPSWASTGADADLAGSCRERQQALQCKVT